MNSLTMQLLTGFLCVAVLTAVFYAGSRLLTRWVVVGRPTGRFRRTLKGCEDIVAAARNGT